MKKKMFRFIWDDLKTSPYDIVFVNDDSSDQSCERLSQLGAEVLQLPVYLGIGGCVQTGYLYALLNDYDIAIQYDGDGQHDAKYLSALVDKINEGYDYVIGSRYISDLAGFKSTVSRRIGINILSFLIMLVSKKRIYDVTSGFRACNKILIRQFVNYYPTDYPEPEVAGGLAKQKYKICEVPVRMRERQGGASSIRF